MKYGHITYKKVFISNSYMPDMILSLIFAYLTISRKSTQNPDPPLIVTNFLRIFKSSKCPKNVKKRITMIQMNCLFQIFMVIVDRIKNRVFFFSQKLKKSKSRLKNGGSHAPVFNFKRSTPRK